MTTYPGLRATYYTPYVLYMIFCVPNVQKNVATGETFGNGKDVHFTEPGALTPHSTMYNKIFLYVTLIILEISHKFYLRKSYSF